MQKNINNNNNYNKANQFSNASGSSSNSTKQIKIGNYILGKTIGKGNSAVVKIATHAIIKQKVAIKMFDKSVLDNDKQTRLMREIESMKRLKHPNIIRIYEIMETAKIICIVTEIASNGELYDYITHKKRLSEREARHIFKQIVTSIHYCHKNNVVHRDIKVENILLDNNGRVKLADFGFSTFFKHGELLDTWCGSPQYCAPELYLAKLYEGPNVDIWSLGVVLYILVCGCLPFEAQVFTALRAQVINGSYRTPFFLSPECKNLIDGMLTFDPNKRIKMNEIINHKWMKCANIESNLGDFSDSGMSDNIDLSLNDHTTFQDFRNLVDKVEQISINEFIPDEAVLYEITRYGLNVQNIIDSVRYNKFDSNAAIYYLLEYRLANNSTNTTTAHLVSSPKLHSTVPSTNRFTKIETTSSYNNNSHNNNANFNSLTENSSFNDFSSNSRNSITAMNSIDSNHISKMRYLKSLHDNALEMSNQTATIEVDSNEPKAQAEKISNEQHLQIKEENESIEDIVDDEEGDMLIEQQGRDYLCRNKTRRHTIGTNIDKIAEADIVKSTECLLMLDESEEYEELPEKSNPSNESSTEKCLSFDQDFYNDTYNKRSILKKRHSQSSTCSNQQAFYSKPLAKPSSKSNKVTLLSSQYRFNTNDKSLLAAPTFVNRRASDGGSNIVLFNQIYALKNSESQTTTSNRCTKYSEINENNASNNMNVHNNHPTKYLSRGSITSGMPIFPSLSQLSPSTTSSDSQNLNSSEDEEAYSNSVIRYQRKNSRNSRHEPYNLDNNSGNSLLAASGYCSSGKRKSFSGSTSPPIMLGQTEAYNLKKNQDPLELIYSNRARLEGIYNQSIGALSPAKELQFLQETLTIEEQAKLKYSKKSRKSILGQLNYEPEATQPISDLGNYELNETDLHEQQTIDQQQQAQSGLTVNNSDNLNSIDISNLSNISNQSNNSNSKSPSQMLHIIREEQNEMNVCNNNNNNINSLSQGVSLDLNDKNILAMLQEKDYYESNKFVNQFLSGTMLNIFEKEKSIQHQHQNQQQPKNNDI